MIIYLKVDGTIVTSIKSTTIPFNGFVPSPVTTLLLLLFGINYLLLSLKVLSI